MAAQRFMGTLEAGPGGGAFVVLPGDVLVALGGGSRFRVTGSISGVEFDSSTMAMGGGRVCVGIHKATRNAAGLEIGDAVDVHLDRDTRPRLLDIPADLAEALARDDGARAAFERLSFTRRREHVESVAQRRARRNPSAANRQRARATSRLIVTR
jgi:hypothetical protein